MQERVLKYLLDIQTAINEIDSYFKGYLYDFNLYKQNSMLKKTPCSKKQQKEI
jgi:hypothetical protein